MSSGSPLIRDNLTEFFRELLLSAMSAQDVRSSADTEFYLVKLLEGFARPRRDWFDRPLAVDYLESFQASSADRYLKLKRVADTALFLSGMFMETVERGIVGCDYYISLGQLAYGRLARTEGPAVSKPFSELADRFRDFVAVLGEISFSELFRGETHLLRVYTRWARTGSKRDRDWLARHGLVPVTGTDRLRH